MDETRGVVRLVDFRPETEARSLVATIDREEVEKALWADDPVDLQLDVERVADGGGRETQRIIVGWESDDLKRLLASSSAQELPLTFDEAELHRLLDEDVDAHGMRDKLAVLTVVAGMAAAGAGAAAGAIPRDEGGSGAGGAPVAAAATQAPASEVSTGLGTMQEPQTGRAATASEISTGVVGVTPVAPSEISTGVVQEPPATPAEVTTGIVSGPTAAPADSSPSGWSIDPTEAALAAGTILAVVAAGFIARTHRHRPATP